MLDLLLSTTGAESSGLQAIGMPRDVAWHLRLHERSLMQYRAHTVAVQRLASRPGAAA
jgi:hypothetical protein